MTLAFTVPGPPHGKGRPRASLQGGRVHMRTDKRTAAYEDRVCWHAEQAAADASWGPPVSGPVKVRIVAYRKRPQRPGPRHECRAGTVHRGAILCTAKPDADNIAKAILDGCAGAGVWGDDVQVAALEVVKLWCNEGEEPRTDVAVWPLGGA